MSIEFDAFVLILSTKLVYCIGKGMKEIRKILGLYDQLKADGTNCALAIVVNVAGSSYRRIGARLLVAEDGRFVGGISGGCLEGDALRRARRAILADQPSVHVYDTLDGDDEVIGIGLGCNGRIEVLFIPIDFTASNELDELRIMAGSRTPQLLTRVLAAPGMLSGRLYTRIELEALGKRYQLGSGELSAAAGQIMKTQRSKTRTFLAPGRENVTILFEVIRPELHLIVTGTNYDIPPTLAAAKQMGWRTTVIGARRKFTKEIDTLTDHLLDYSEVGQASIDQATAVALMSHDYEWDKRMVQYFLPQKPPYLGMLGPRKRVEKMDEELPELGLLAYPNLYAPVGLDIGAETPEEIAASLIAEILMVFRGRQGSALRERIGKIHPT
ncbi:MAG: XdhC family protein [Bacteroidota bacterium]